MHWKRLSLHLQNHTFSKHKPTSWVFSSNRLDSIIIKVQNSWFHSFSFFVKLSKQPLACMPTPPFQNRSNWQLLTKQYLRNPAWLWEKGLTAGYSCCLRKKNHKHTHLSFGTTNFVQIYSCNESAGGDKLDMLILNSFSLTQPWKATIYVHNIAQSVVQSTI